MAILTRIEIPELNRNEAEKFDSLWKLGSLRTTTGNVTFASTTSSVVYNTLTSYGGTYANQGQTGLYNMLKTEVLNAGLLDIAWVNSISTTVNNATIAVGSKATTDSYTVTIPSTSWSGSSAPFTRAVTVSGILSTDKPIVDIVASGTYATDVIMGENWGKIYRIVTSTNTITIYANEVPSASIPIVLKVVR